MTKALTKVVYKPQSTSTDEYTLIVNPEQYKKWKDGDTTIPLSQVVDSFNVYFSNQGHQGILGKPSKQQLETVFNTSKDDEVVAKILKEGKVQAGDGFNSSGQPITNASRGRTSVEMNPR